MGLTVQRDLGTVSDAIAAWARHHLGADDVVISSCERASDGLSNETLLIEARCRRASATTTESFVVRLPPAGPWTFPEYDLTAQAQAQRVIASCGVPAAVPVEVVNDTRWLGAPFLVMPMVPGRVVAGQPSLDPWVTESSPQLQARLYEAFIDQLAAVHQIDPTVAAGLVPARDIDAELAYWGRYLDWYGDGQAIVPALVDGLAWCAAHRPPGEPPPSLLWGDVRLGNVIFDEQRAPVALLDWEMATIGAAEHDVAWLQVLEALEDELIGRPVPGFPSPADALGRYEAALGRSLQHLEWFEIFALVRSTAILSRITLLHERAGAPTLLPLADNPILDILARRISQAP